MTSSGAESLHARPVSSAVLAHAANHRTTWHPTTSFGMQGAAVACCSVQTPITALLALDVANCDWRGALSDRFVMNANADPYRFEVRGLESLTSGGRINLSKFRRIRGKIVADTVVSCATARKSVLQQFALGHAR